MVKKNVLLDEVNDLIDEFIRENKGLLAGIDFVIGVSRGGLVPAALLATRIDKPLVSAYIDKNDAIFFDRSDWIKGKKVLVVDDIVRSGKTLWLLKDHLENNSSPARLEFFALFSVASLKKESYDVCEHSRKINEDVILPWDNK